METEKNIEKIILEMRNETASMRGDEFGIFDYQDLDTEMREQKWFVLSYIIDMGKIESKDLAVLLEKNPWFNDWYKRTVLSEVPQLETYH